MLYKPATVHDLDSFFEAAKELTATSVHKELSKDKIKTILSGFPYWNMSVFKDGKIIGFIVGVASQSPFTDVTDVWDLGLYVNQEHRGGTIAYRLVKALEQWAGSLGASKVWLGQSVNNKIEKTTSFYTRMGYTCVGTNNVKELILKE